MTGGGNRRRWWAGLVALAGAFALTMGGWYILLFAALAVLFFLVSRSILRRNLNLQ